MINRERQSEILKALIACYPSRAWIPDLFPDMDYQSRLADVAYLAELGLCESGIELAGDGQAIFSGSSRATAAGIDFLADDGGLSAILKTITVKLHADTIRDLLAKKVDEADLPADEKSALRKAVEGLPAAALTAGAGDLVKMGLDHAPGAIGFIRVLVGM